MDGWIKIEDRLPDNIGEYIVYAQDENSPASEGVWYENVVIVAEYAFGEWREKMSILFAKFDS